MIFASHPGDPNLDHRALEAYRLLLQANERHLRTGDRRDRSRKRRRRVPLMVLALEPDDHMTTASLALSPGSALVLRPRALRSQAGLEATLAYADIMSVPLVADFTNEGLGALIDPNRFGMACIRMTIDAGTRQIFPVVDLDAVG